MPKLLYARPPADVEERTIRRLAGSRHAPADWVMRAKMIAASWDGERTSAIAARLGCHMQTVRERLARFNSEGLDGLADRRRCVVEPADVLNPRRVRGQIAWASSVNAAATRVVGGASTASS
jgi:hypothetical protein